MKRISARELLDDDAGTAREVADSLLDIDRLNRWLGGISTTTRLVRRIAEATRRRHFSMLDVAAGSGSATRSVRTRLARRGIGLRLTLLDRRPGHLKICDGEDRVIGDALALPFRDESFDLIACCLFVHHLSPGEVASFIREALRCSRVAVLVNDLVRHPLHLAAARAGRLIYRSRLTRFDGPASVRQAYTPPELCSLLEQAGAVQTEVTRHFFYRMGVIVWKDMTFNGASARLV